MNPRQDDEHAPATAPVKERKRRLTYHHIVNLDDVRHGYDDTFRALCGATFPARHGLLAGEQPAGVTREWVKCPACDYMERLRDSFGL